MTKPILKFKEESDCFSALHEKQAIIIIMESELLCYRGLESRDDKGSKRQTLMAQLQLHGLPIQARFLPLSSGEFHRTHSI